jgi:hypothetical protein
MSLTLVMTWDMRRLLTPARVAMLVFRRGDLAGRICRLENILQDFLAERTRQAA